MMENARQLVLDDAESKTRLQFPDGAILAVGTKQDNDDPTHYGVHLLNIPATEVVILQDALQGVCRDL